MMAVYKVRILKAQILRIVSDSQKKKKHQAQNEENVLQYRFFFCKQKASTEVLNDHDKNDAIQQESFGNTKVQQNFECMVLKSQQQPWTHLLCVSKQEGILAEAHMVALVVFSQSDERHLYLIDIR